MKKLWGVVVAWMQSFDPGMVRAIILKIVRWSMTVAGAALVAHGKLTNSQLEIWLSWIPPAAGLAYSIYDAYVVKAKITNATIVGRAEVGKTPEKNEAVAALKETTK
jgi:hypothetical protein